MNVPNGNNHDVDVRSPACGLIWMTVGGLIFTLSILSVDQQPLREVLVYGAQGVLVFAYGKYRLRVARPVTVEATPSRRRDRLHLRRCGARHGGQTARAVPRWSG
jgi:hypothetical protein